MTAFSPRRSAEILRSGPLARLEGDIAYVCKAIYNLMWDGYPSWHRLVHELESEKDALWDRYWSLREHIQWLYAEDDRRLADLGMSR